MEAYKNQDEGVLTEIEELFNLIIKVNNKITTGVDDDSVSQVHPSPAFPSLCPWYSGEASPTSG